METTPSEFDLIQDILGCSEDKRMGADIDQVSDSDSVAKVLQNHGYYHITREFLDVLVDYSNLLSQVGLIHSEAMDNLRTFAERCADNIGTFCAVGVIAALKFGVQTPFTPSYLIAISGVAALIQQRFLPSKPE